VVICTVGCHRPDPATDRLPVASEAIIYTSRPNPDYNRIWITTPPGEIPPGHAVVDPTTGTRVRIVADDQPDEKGVPGDRKVIVRVVEGEFVGITGTIDRDNLRPISTR
jgi:hypothetical protein